MYNENKNNSIKNTETLKKIQAERRFTTQNLHLFSIVSPQIQYGMANFDTLKNNFIRFLSLLS